MYSMYSMYIINTNNFRLHLHLCFYAQKINKIRELQECKILELQH